MDEDEKNWVVEIELDREAKWPILEAVILQTTTGHGQGQWLPGDPARLG
jgi:hypothetical protein